MTAHQALTIIRKICNVFKAVEYKTGEIRALQILDEIHALLMKYGVDEN